MSNKIFRISMIFLFVLVFSAGCVPDARELDQRSLIMGLAIDKGENKLYSITIQLPLLGVETGGAAVGPFARDFETFTGEGDTLWEALSALEARTPTVLFLGHLKAVFISKAIAEKHVRGILDFLERETAVAKQIFLVVVEEGKAEDLIKIESPLVHLPSIYFNQYFAAGQKIARTTDVKLFEFNRDSNMINHAAFMPLARIEGERMLDIEGLAIFQNYQLKGELHMNEVALSVLMKEDALDGMNEIVAIEQNGEKIDVSLTRMELSQRMDFKKTNPVEIHLDVKGRGEIIALSDISAKVTNEVYEQVGEAVSRKIEDNMKKVIEKLKNLNVDPLLFGHRIWIRDPGYFETLNWDVEGWRDSVINIHVDFEIQNSGQRNYLGKQKIGR